MLHAPIRIGASAVIRPSRPVAVAAFGVFLLIATPLSAQQVGQPVKLRDVLAAFLVDSGVRTTGLPWTTGNDLPVRWDTPGPVANPDQWAAKQGFTHARQGTFLGTLGDSVALGMTIVVSGIPQGLAQVVVVVDSTLVGGTDGGFFLTREMIEDALKHDGIALQPLKCKRESEGASYGNLVDAFKVPGKTASGLWWHWEAPQQQLVVTLTILYRRAAMNQVECNGG